MGRFHEKSSHRNIPETTSLFSARSRRVLPTEPNHAADRMSLIFPSLHCFQNPFSRNLIGAAILATVPPKEDTLYLESLLSKLAFERRLTGKIVNVSLFFLEWGWDKLLLTCTTVN